MGLGILLIGIAIIWHYVQKKQGEKVIIKFCRTCGKAIGRKAHVCEHCGEKQKKTTGEWFIILFVLFFFLKVISNTIDLFPSKLEEAKKEKIATTENYNLKQVAETDKFKIAVVSIEEKNELKSIFAQQTPAKGGVYIAVVWNYKNITEKPINSSNFPRIKLVDEAGTEYSQDYEATINFSNEINKDTKILSDLNPDIMVTDAQIFEVSKEKFNINTWKVLIKADKDIIVNLNK